ncbi:glycerol-3-phosphate 1-O-acyltransferase PlsY [bacterium]|nr:glycerol-3-phosphate 1-O-acyltransferase PlsY [bacterium]
MITFTAILISYLLGSVPSGVFIARIWGLSDIRQSGSGNIGATNVYRHLGLGPGLLTLILDIAKGAISVSLGLAANPTNLTPWITGLACIIGHIYPVYLQFKGGKGIATSLGVFMILAPLATFISFIVWVIMLVMTRRVSLASLSAVSCLALLLVVFASTQSAWSISMALLVLIFWSHRENIGRLYRGEEPVIGKIS